MTENIFGKNLFDLFLLTYTAASHQGAMEMFWLHLWDAVMSSIFIIQSMV